MSRLTRRMASESPLGRTRFEIIDAAGSRSSAIPGIRAANSAMSCAIPCLSLPDSVEGGLWQRMGMCHRAFARGVTVPGTGRPDGSRFRPIGRARRADSALRAVLREKRQLDVHVLDQAP